MEFKTMPVISETKKNQICDSLVSHGVQPSETAINAIIDIMKNDGRISLATAAKRYAETLGTNHHSPAPGVTRSQQSAQVANDSIQGKISAARDAVRRNTKAQIIVGGISDALADIALGNFDDLELEAIAALDDFTNQLNQTHHLLLEAEVNPVPLLLASATSAGDIE
jgi:hypothetical protein